MLSNELIHKIEEVLNSNLSAYMVAKKVGYSSANQVHKFINGKSSLKSMSLEKAIAFEELYESEIKSMEGNDNG